MRRHLQFLTILAALAAPCGVAQAQTLNAAKIDSINKAADSFVALGKNSSTTGKPPRYSDPAVKPLLDTVLNTKDIEDGKPLPWASVELLRSWHGATQKVGLVYYLAGTGTDDVVAVSKDPQKIQKANNNTVAFWPEFGRYYDAQIRLHSAMIDAAVAQLAVATPEQRRDPAFRTTLNNISDGTAKAMTGLLGTFVQDGLPDDWLLLRAVVLLEITPKAAKFMEPNDRTQVRNAATEVAEHSKNPDVKSAVNSIARAFELL
jgi:hypothetical protein